MRLKWLFADVSGGSWGVEPGESDVQALCVRGTDFDYAHLRVNRSRAPTRAYSSSEFRKRAARNGDIIIEKSGGGDQQPVGRAVLYDGDELVVPTNFAARLRPRAEVDSRFATYLLASLWSDGRTRAVIKQTTGIQNLDLDALLDLKITCPSFSRQQEIADYLDRETARIDALIAAKQRSSDLINERRRAIRDAAFAHRPGLRLKRLLAAPMAYGVLVPEFVAPGTGIPMIRTYNLKGAGEISHDDIAEISAGLASEYKRTALRAGDLILSVVGSMGRSAVVTKSEEGFNLNRPLARLRPRNELAPRLLWHWTQTTHFLDMASLATGGGTAQPTLNLGDLANFAVGLPQNPQIWPRTLSELDAACEGIRSLEVALVHQLSLLRERRRALITAAVTGSLPVALVA